jgi:hypothetical protein
VTELERAVAEYSLKNGYPATRYAAVRCGACGGREHRLWLDEQAGVAVAGCAACGDVRALADGAEYMDEAALDDCVCTCDTPVFELVLGVSLYSDSQAVRWLYVGARCVACGLAGCYGDWKNEHDDWRLLLADA